MMFPNERIPSIPSIPSLPPMKQRTALPTDYEPSPNDVCSGRGKKNWNHEGNTLFRKLVRDNVQAYQDAPDKASKNAVVNGIVEIVRIGGGRFLKRDDQHNWYDIGDHQAREKVGHSLRDQVNAQIRAAQQHEDQQEGPEGLQLLSQDGMASSSHSLSSRKKRESPPPAQMFSATSSKKHKSGRNALKRSLSLPDQSPTRATHTDTNFMGDQQVGPYAASSTRHPSLEFNFPLSPPLDPFDPLKFTNIPTQSAQAFNPLNQGLGGTSGVLMEPHPQGFHTRAGPPSNWSLNNQEADTPDQGRVQYPNFLLPLDASMEPTPLPEPLGAESKVNLRREEECKLSESKRSSPASDITFPIEHPFNDM